jgi:hypothetical protein
MFLFGCFKKVVTFNHKTVAMLELSGGAQSFGHERVQLRHAGNLLLFAKEVVSLGYLVQVWDVVIAILVDG